MGRIAISYRREDSGVITGRIFDRLVARYGRDTVFRDIDDVPIGVDFRTHIERVLQKSDVVLAIVGPRWFGPSPAESRLDNETDLVRAEIAEALSQGRPIIPVLVFGASMPTAAQLPDALRDFSYRNAVQLDAERDFDVGMARLIRAIDGIFGSSIGSRALFPGKFVRSWRRPIAATVLVMLLIAAFSTIGWRLDNLRQGVPARTSPPVAPDLPKVTSTSSVPNLNSIAVQFENNPVAASAVYNSERSILFEFDKTEITDDKIVVSKSIRPNFNIYCSFPKEDLAKMQYYAVGEQIPASVTLKSYRSEPDTLITFNCKFDQLNFEKFRFDLDERLVSECLDKPDRHCMDVALKATGVTDFSNIFAGGCTTFQTARLDEIRWKDIWTTSVYSYAEGASTPGGGREDDSLKVGGWGDWYYSLITFDVELLPKQGKQAFLVFYSLRTGGTPVAMHVDRIVSAWSWVASDRLWWKDRPQTVPWGASPAPRRNTWYPVDITGLLRRLDGQQDRQLWAATSAYAEQQQQ